MTRAMPSLEEILAATRAVAAAARRGGDRLALARALRAAKAAASCGGRSFDGGVSEVVGVIGAKPPPVPPLSCREILLAASAVCQVWSGDQPDLVLPAEDGGSNAC
jgi:hypothetical protein